MYACFILVQNSYLLKIRYSYQLPFFILKKISSYLNLAAWILWFCNTIEKIMLIYRLIDIIWRLIKIWSWVFSFCEIFLMLYSNLFQVKQLWYWLGMVSHYGMKRTSSQAVLMCHWLRRVWRRQLKLVRESATYPSTWYIHQPWYVRRWLPCLPWLSIVAKR